MTPEEEIANIKLHHFARLTHKSVWFIVEDGADFVVHEWTADGVAPQSSYPTKRKAAARLLQLLGTGPVAPQTYPESVCIGSVDAALPTEGRASE